MFVRAHNHGFSFPSALGRILLNTGGGEGNGSGSTGNTEGGAGGGNGGGGTAPEAGRGEAFIKKHGSAAEAVDVLLSEAHRNREKIRDLEAKVPQAGSRVLSADEAKTFDALLSLGSADEVKRKVRDFDGLDAKVKGFERDRSLDAVAEAAKVDGRPIKASVLKGLPGVSDLAFETRPVKVDGKDVPTVFVKHKAADGKDAETPFHDYAATAWKDFLPALAPGEAAPPTRTQGTPPRGQGPAARQQAPAATGGQEVASAPAKRLSFV